MKRRIGWHALAMLAMSIGCGSSASPADCLTVKPKATSGVYGCVTATDDVGTNVKPEVLPNFGVEVFAEEPPPTPGDGLAPLVSTKSNSLGFYELALTPGTYSLCTTFRRCTAIVINANEPLRKNYDFSQSLGWQQ